MAATAEEPAGGEEQAAPAASDVSPACLRRVVLTTGAQGSLAGICLCFSVYIVKDKCLEWTSAGDVVSITFMAAGIIWDAVFFGKGYIPIVDINWSCRLSYEHPLARPSPSRANKVHARVLGVPLERALCAYVLLDNFGPRRRLLLQEALAVSAFDHEERDVLFLIRFNSSAIDEIASWKHEQLERLSSFSAFGLRPRPQRPVLREASFRPRRSDASSGRGAGPEAGPDGSGRAHPAVSSLPAFSATGVLSSADVARHQTSTPDAYASVGPLPPEQWQARGQLVQGSSMHDAAAANRHARASGRTDYSDGDARRASIRRQGTLFTPPRPRRVVSDPNLFLGLAGPGCGPPLEPGSLRNQSRPPLRWPFTAPDSLQSLDRGPDPGDGRARTVSPGAFFVDAFSGSRSFGHCWDRPALYRRARARYSGRFSDQHRCCKFF